ncbi:unnamed protein product [Angiostrongylus costaricensis]|uniref:MFS domain-containing protein n=1 Tax=Angiostrongylus costaricensis TaxID=334426 RepID=A0A158PJP6_ANGCS|nr:unnamed protein product [Angiostrongylus costaricensis]
MYLLWHGKDENDGADKRHIDRAPPLTRLSVHLQHSEWRRIYMAFFGFFILFSETGVRQVMNIFVPSITVAYNCTKTEVDTVVIVLPTCLPIFLKICTSYFNNHCFGCALMRNAIISVQCEYFTSMRNTVMSFISIGPGIGIFLLPRILVSLINKFSWNFGFRFLATLYIICGIIAIFITKRSATQQHSFAHFTGIKEIFLRKKYYHGIASIIGRSLLTLFLGLTNANILIVMIFNYVVAQGSIFSASFCFTLWEFRIQNVFAGVGIGFFQATLAQFLLSMVGPSQLPGALGYTNLVNGAAAFTAVHIAGTVRLNEFFLVYANTEGDVNMKEVEIPELRIMLKQAPED